MVDVAISHYNWNKYLAFLLTEASFVCDELGHNLPYTLQPINDHEDVEKLYLRCPAPELPLRCQLVLAMLELNGHE